MVPFAVLVLTACLAISHSSVITELPEIGAPSKAHEALPSTSLPEKTTRGPHTHEEHPVDDPDHSDHIHEASASTVDDHDHSGHDHKSHTGRDHHDGHVHDDRSGQDEHDHPGHDHSESGHSHEDDHKEETKSVSDVPDVSSTKVTKEEPDKVDDIGNRARRDLWRRRID